MSASPATANVIDAETATPAAAQAQQFRQHIGHVSRHSSVFLLGTIFAGTSGYLFKIYLARKIGPNALGLYALGMTMVGFAGIFSDVGLPQAAVRFVATYSATGRIRQLAAFLFSASVVLLGINALCAGVLATAGKWVVIHFYHAPELVPYMWLFAGISFLAGVNTFLGHVLGGYKDIARRSIITNFIGSPAAIVITVVLVSIGTGLWGYTVAHLLTAGIVCVLLGGSVWRLSPRREFGSERVGFHLEREVLSYSGIAFGAGLLEYVIGHADKVLIGFYLDPRALGIYAISAAVVSFIPILLHSVNQIFSPVMADLFARGELALLQRLFQTLTKWIILLTAPAGFLAIIFAPQVMLLFGQAFATGWPILVIGTVAQLINCAVGSVGYLLLMCGQQRRLVRLQIVCAGLMLAFNILLVPRWGIIGAAIATAATTIAINLLSLAEVRRTLKLSPYNQSYLSAIPVLVMSCATGFFARISTSAVLPWWLGLLISAAVMYGVLGGSFVVIGHDADDQMIFDAVVRRFRQKISMREAS